MRRESATSVRSPRERARSRLRALLAVRYIRTDLELSWDRQRALPGMTRVHMEEGYAHESLPFNEWLTRVQLAAEELGRDTP